MGSFRHCLDYPASAQASIPPVRTKSRIILPGVAANAAFPIKLLQKDIKSTRCDGTPRRTASRARSGEALGFRHNGIRMMQSRIDKTVREDP
jgi:hypothetical protein